MLALLWTGRSGKRGYGNETVTVEEWIGMEKEVEKRKADEDSESRKNWRLLLFV